MNNLNKGDLMKLILSDEERMHCDSAIPLSAANALREQASFGLEYDQAFYVTDVKNNKLVHLGERLITSGKLAELLDELQEEKYKNKQLRKKLNLTPKQVEELPLDFD